MSIVCEEVFDEGSHPSVDEIRDYAAKIGIDPDSEPQLLPLAAEGLMKALPPGWKPCYNDKTKSYYYYNNLTGKTQWEHPLDDVYRGLVKKVRAESQSLSLGEPTEDATYARDDELPSLEEPPLPLTKKLEPLKIKLSPLKTQIQSTSPKHESKLLKQKSDEHLLTNRKISLNIFSNSFDEKTDFDKHPRSLEKNELKLSGGGSMFLKSNTAKKEKDSKNDGPPSLEPPPRSILRERGSMEFSKSTDFSLNGNEKGSSEKDDDDKKSVRFNLDNTTDVAFTFSDKSSSDEEIKKDIINVKLTPIKSRFSVSPVIDFEDSGNPNLKLIKPNPADFIKPKLTLNKGSESEDDSKSETPAESRLKRRLEEKTDKKIAQMKQNIWEEKNDELAKFRDDVQESHKGELERILITAKTEHEDKIKAELENLRIEMENRNDGALKSEREKLEESWKGAKSKLELSFEKEEKKLIEGFAAKREELEKYYDDKLVEIEKELAERMERNRDEMILTHNSNIEQLKQNHSIILEEIKKGFKAEEDVLRKEHKAVMAELKGNKEPAKTDVSNEKYDKIRCEKRLLEDKYRCLKEKYLRLKSDVKMSIEKRNKRKEQSGTTTTTGSETERSYSNNKERTPLDSPVRKPPTTPKLNRNQDLPKPNNKPEHRATRQLIIQDLDTSISDKSIEDKKNDYESSDNNSANNPGRSRKKLFSRMKSSSTSRINNNAKSRRNQRSCSPVENLRRQLQKLEDLEDQFPQNPQSDTYHLRYPFSDTGVQKFEGSSELEFFRHRIHLERDSIKRAKESLRTQKTLFQQRQKELKLKHGSMARHTLQQLCQEEKELTDMEVSLHRTRSLLGEKVIRLRHLEMSLQRATVTTENRLEDATLSDISSHSASSGISSTEFATAPDVNLSKFIQGEHLQESSEIIQSLENLNSEIREIWDVLRKQQQQSGAIATVIPPLVYPDLGWPLLAGAAAAAVPAPPSIPTLADRLHNYRQHVALANAQSTVVTHAANHQGATTTLVERTRNLRHWLRQAGIDNNIEGSGPPQATL